jgi:hypothetical protein
MRLNVRNTAMITMIDFDNIRKKRQYSPDNSDALFPLSAASNVINSVIIWQWRKLPRNHGGFRIWFSENIPITLVRLNSSRPQP